MNEWSIGLTLLLALASVLAKDVQLLNVSYGPTHELYEQYSRTFSAHWKQETGDNVVIRQSHGDSDKQATSVINGIKADVVTLALAYDVDAIVKRGRIDKGRIKRLPDNPTPYTPTIIFLVRKGNPRRIHDRNDLVEPGMSTITPNLKSSDGARWNYLAAWGCILHHNNNDQTKAQGFVKALYKNAKVFGSDARDSTNTFVERGIGDALITWKDEALLTTSELDKDKFKIVTLSESILAEPTVSVVDKVVEKKDTKAVTKAYLRYLYSPEGQEIAMKDYYRPCDTDVVKRYEDVFPKLKLFTIDEEFGGWTETQKGHFSNDGTFDQVSKR